MTDNIFEDDQTKNNNQTTEGNNDNQQNSNESSNDLLGELVGEGKKFKSIDDLARGKLEADKFIEQLKDEMRQLREDLSNQPSKEELLQTLKERTAYDGEDTTSQIDESAIAELVESTLSQREKQRTAAENLKVAQDRAVNYFGDFNKAKDAIIQKANELNMPVEELQNIAARSPKAFEAMLGISEKVTQSTRTTTDGTINTDSLSSGNTGEESWEYFQKMRKENPRMYYTPKVQNRIFELKKQGKI